MRILTKKKWDFPSWDTPIFGPVFAHDGPQVGEPSQHFSQAHQKSNGSLAQGYIQTPLPEGFLSPPAHTITPGSFPVDFGALLQFGTASQNLSKIDAIFDSLMLPLRATFPMSFFRIGMRSPITPINLGRIFISRAPIPERFSAELAHFGAIRTPPGETSRFTYSLFFCHSGSCGVHSPIPMGKDVGEGNRKRVSTPALLPHRSARFLPGLGGFYAARTPPGERTAHTFYGSKEAQTKTRRAFHSSRVEHPSHPHFPALRHLRVSLPMGNRDGIFVDNLPHNRVYFWGNPDF